MNARMRKLAFAGLILASMMPLASTGAQAVPIFGLLRFGDTVVKAEREKALAIPEHARWCSKQRPGYRKKWNNWRMPNGRVKYCASPFFKPVWMQRITTFD